MRATSRLLGAAAAAVLTTAVLVPAAPAAAAATCARGYHCGYLSGGGTVMFFSSEPDFRVTGPGGTPIDNNIVAAANNSAANYMSFYYYGVNYTGGLAFCVNPGQTVVNLPHDGVAGNGNGQAYEASSLRLVAGGPSPLCY